MRDELFIWRGFFAFAAMSINRTYARICGVKSSFHHAKTAHSLFFLARPTCWYFRWTARVKPHNIPQDIQLLFCPFLISIDIFTAFSVCLKIHLNANNSMERTFEMERLDECKVDNYISVKVLLKWSSSTRTM